MRAICIGVSLFLFTACAMWQKTGLDARCAAACVGINALNCWDSPDLSTALAASTRFMSCETACAADPSFSVDLDISCFVDAPQSCEAVAECIDLR